MTTRYGIKPSQQRTLTDVRSMLLTCQDDTCVNVSWARQKWKQTRSKPPHETFATMYTTSVMMGGHVHANTISTPGTDTKMQRKVNSKASSPVDKGLSLCQSHLHITHNKKEKKHTQPHTTEIGDFKGIGKNRAEPLCPPAPKIEHRLIVTKQVEENLVHVAPLWEPKEGKIEMMNTMKAPSSASKRIPKRSSIRQLPRVTWNKKGTPNVGMLDLIGPNGLNPMANRLIVAGYSTKHCQKHTEGNKKEQQGEPALLQQWTGNAIQHTKNRKRTSPCIK